MRAEKDIFAELEHLCSFPGYIHAIAHLCFRDNVIGYDDEVTADHIMHLFSNNRLIRTEISTLIGLLIKNDIDLSLPSPSTVQGYLDKTEALLGELHDSMNTEMAAKFHPENLVDEGYKPFANGKALREPIFYSGESAYISQYRDLAPKKYAYDDDWLLRNRGFSIQSAANVVRAIGEIQSHKLISTLNSLRNLKPDEWTLLPGFMFTAQEVTNHSGMNLATVDAVLSAFTFPESEKNSAFRTVSEFNLANAFPLIPVNAKSFVLFQNYSLAEALYESPFYWMCSDSTYVDIAMRHRGKFTEELSRERLELVFGSGNVFSNVGIYTKGTKRAGEIDVLVTFGDRAIILQAKSKRLTVEARKGNDNQIREDFKKSVQDAYDQGYLCATLISEQGCALRDATETDVSVPSSLKEIYIFCVVSDHYPALSFQARQFLKFLSTPVIRAPFVMDVFALDVITEMLQSPLRLLSYASRRADYSERLMASSELTILGYHLKRNLWLDDEDTVLVLHDDVAADLDVAMAVRRDGVPGNAVPDGILSRLGTTVVGRIIESIERREDPRTIELGFVLLELGEKTVEVISRSVNKIAKWAERDGNNHDVTVGLGKLSSGLTIHCNSDPVLVAETRLRQHCEMRRYTEKADNWFGLCLSSGSASLRFGINLSQKWRQSAVMDQITANAPKPTPIDKLRIRPARRKKIGRNEPCPCGSGLKYKKCCLGRQL